MLEQGSVKLRDIRSPGGIYCGLFPGKKPHFSSKNTKLSQQCTFSLNLRTPNFFLQNLHFFSENFRRNFLLQDLVAPSRTSPFFRENCLIQKFTENTCFILGNLSGQKGNFQCTALKIAPCRSHLIWLKTPAPVRSSRKNPGSARPGICTCAGSCEVRPGGFP